MRNLAARRIGFARRARLADVPNLKIQTELISFAYKFACRRERRPLLVAHLDLQFSSVTLRGSG